jgi:hypothetical protein
MAVFGTIIAVIAGLLVVAMLVEAWLKRGRYRPLTSGIDFGPEGEGKRELGTEAIDFDVVNSAIRKNNASGLTNSTREMSQYLKYRNIKPQGLKDDENYARRWLETYGPHDKGTKE